MWKSSTERAQRKLTQGFAIMLVGFAIMLVGLVVEIFIS
jgi:hypothetical protein